MDTSLLPILLGIATLLPLLSFALILTTVRWLKPSWGGTIATSAIVGSGLLALASLAIWISHHWPQGTPHHEVHTAHAGTLSNDASPVPDSTDLVRAQSPEHDGSSGPADHNARGAAVEHLEANGPYTGDYYLLGRFGKLRITISYYIDALTIVMFCMVTLIASCIHIYAQGYMHEEERDVTDHEVTLENGEFSRNGRGDTPSFSNTCRCSASACWA